MRASTPRFASLCTSASRRRRRRRRHINISANPSVDRYRLQQAELSLLHTLDRRVQREV